MALYRLVEKAYLRSVDGFVFNSQATRGVVEQNLGQRRPAWCGRHPGRGPLGGGLSEEEIIERCREGQRLRILFVGNLIERKGLHTLIRAAGRAARGGLGAACSR